MDASDLQNQLIKVFPDADEATLRECADVCVTYNLDAATLKWKWEAFSINSRKGQGMLPIDIDSIRVYKAKLALELAGAAKRADAPSVRTRRQPPVQAAAAATASSGPRPGSTATTSAKPFVRTSTAPVVTERRYKYMYEKILERSDELDDRIDHFADLIREHYGITEFGDPFSSTDDDVVVVGRICCDADAKLNEASMLLEPSRIVGSGIRVPIRLAPNVSIRGGLAQGQVGVGFFPGAMAAFKGRNGGGGWFVANEILPSPPLARNEKPGPSVDVSLCIAAGPYTYENDFEFVPLKALLKRVEDQKPTAILLLGPFIDANHAKIKDGDIDEHPQEIFQREILSPLAACARWGTTVYIVPSLRDIVSDHAVFPQGELRDESGGIPQNVRMLPNPCVLSIGGLRVGASSVDVLFQLSQSHFVRTLVDEGGDNYTNLSRYVLRQRSFYPLFPSVDSVNLDVTHSGYLAIEEPAPDVLVLPSKFAAFQKVVDGCAVVNPSFCAKSASLGSYGMVRCAGGEVDVKLIKL